MRTLYTLQCHCGKTKQTHYPTQTSCSKRCASLTPEARARNRANGHKGGAASGITRRKLAHLPGYTQGYSAGWIAGRRHGWAEACGEIEEQRGRAVKAGWQSRQDWEGGS